MSETFCRRKYSLNFCINCEIFVKFKIQKPSNLLYCPKCKKCSKKEAYNCFIGTSHICGILAKEENFMSAKRKKLEEIFNAIEFTECKLQIPKCKLCRDLLDEQDCLMCNFCKTRFCAFCLLTSLKSKSYCSCCSKTLKRSNIVSNTKWKETLYKLFSKQAKMNNERIYMRRSEERKEEDVKYKNDNLVQFNHDSNASHKNSNSFKRSRISEDTDFQDHSPNYQNRPSSKQSQISHQDSFDLFIKRSRNKSCGKRVEETKQELNNVVKQLRCESEKECVKKCNNYIRAIDESSNNHISQIKRLSNFCLPNQESYKEAKEESKASLHCQSTIAKEEIIEILESSDEEVKRSFEANLRLPLNYFKDSNLSKDLSTKMPLNTPLKIDAIIRRVSRNVWEFYCRRPRVMNGLYSCLIRMKKCPYVQMFHAKNSEYIKSTGKGTQVAKLVIPPETDIVNAEGFLFFSLEFYEH